MRSMLRRWFAVPMVAGLALAGAGCGDDEETVQITLQEFSVSADPASVPAGSVTFEATNDGPDDVHEFVVIATDLAITELPTAEDGSVDEAGEGLEVIGGDRGHTGRRDSVGHAGPRGRQLCPDLQHLRRRRGRGALPGGDAYLLHGRVVPDATSAGRATRTRGWLRAPASWAGMLPSQQRLEFLG